MERKIQPSRQLNFSDQKCSGALDNNEDEDCGLTAYISGEDNRDIKPLEISHSKLDMSTSSIDRERISCAETKNKISGHKKSNVNRGNMLSDHNNEESKFHSDKNISGLSENLVTVNATDSLKSVATDGKDLDNNKTSDNFHFLCDETKPTNDEEHCKSVVNDESMKDVETENFERWSDGELFGDPLIFESLCEGTQASCHKTQDQENDESQGGVNFDDKQCRHFSQSLDSVTQSKNSVKIKCCSDVDESQCLLPLEQTIDIKEETQSKQSTTGLKQQSLLSFVAKENKKATTSKASLKQTDIGVFFGLRPLKKHVDSKIAAQSDTKVASSSQVSSVSQRQGGWGTRTKYNRDIKNAGYTSEGQSSGQGEDATAVSTGARSRQNCPFYKKIPNCGITVDAFRYGNIPGCHAYFLSHFHYDHYAGLNGKFTNPVYCSKVNQTCYMYIATLYK